MNPIAFSMRRPFTVMVAVVSVALGSLLAASRMPIDIFPNLNLPVVYVCQPYGGMDPAQMEGLLTNYYEYHFLYIGGIHHVESKNVQGMAIMKLFFHPGTDMAQAMAETIGYVTRSRAFMPPGTVSPFITRFDGGSVPVGYLVLSSETRTVGDIQDQALFRVRPMFAALPGVSAPPPFGGSQRSVVIRLDPDRLRSYSMSPDEVIDALTAGNVISPSGNIRIDDEMPIVPVNSLVKDVDELLTIPIRPGDDPTVYLRDVGTVEDSSDIAVGYALVDGRRAVYILVTKRAEASTLSVVQNVKAAIPDMQAVLPDDIRVSFEFDQSPTVTNSIEAVGVEGLLGAALIGVMVLVFLRDWRSAVVIVLNIPIALAAALFALWVTGQTMNLMTLGGLALAIGVLVDESTVAIENIHVRLRKDTSLATAVKQGTLETAGPRLLAMLCILAVFIPSFFMEGSARALFVPMSLAVGFAMIASYILSSTFVPVLTTWIVRRSHAAEGGGQPARRTGFDRFADGYGSLVRGLTRASGLVVILYLVGAGVVVFGAGRQLGLEIFPTVDAGRFQLRLKAPAGTRVEKTEEIVRDVLAAIEDEVGREAVEISVGYAGLIPSSYPINAIYQWSGGPEEAMLRVALKPGTGVEIEALKRTLRRRLNEEMPTVAFSFEPADIVSDVMSFGSPTPVEVAVSGPDFADVRAHAEKIREELAATPGLSDVRFGQTLDYPAVTVDIDREKAGLSGITPEEIARSLVTATWSSRFVVPNYWPDPKSGIGYQVQVEIPFQEMTSLEDIRTLPIRQGDGVPLLLRDVADVRRSTVPGQYDRYNMKRTLTLTANLVDMDLGRASGAVDRAIARAGEPPKGVNVDVRGQLVPLREILSGLAIGLGMSVVVILLLLTANFQSLRLALVAVAAGPAVLAGVVVGLVLTSTTVNIQSFMGTIMVFGVAVSNAILLVTFAERNRKEEGMNAREAAIAGARGRLRAILMTSGTMIVGMLPMALGLGEGGDQTAPLGRAVIGGLSFATLSTLFVLPGVFAMLQGSVGRDSPSLDPDDPESPHFVAIPAPHLTTSDEPRTTSAGAPLNQTGPDSSPPPRPDPQAGIPSRFGSPVMTFEPSDVVLRTARVVCVAGLATLSGCGTAGDAVPLRAQTRTEAPKPRVATVLPERMDLRRIAGEPGQIEAFETTDLLAKVAGYVRSLAVDIGDRVTAGQVLVELEAHELEAELDRTQAHLEQDAADLKRAESMVEVARAAVSTAEAKVEEARAAIRRTEAEIARWQAEYDRIDRLVNERTVTEGLRDETLSKLESAKASRDEVEAQIRLADASLLQARAELARAQADVVVGEAHVRVAEADVRHAEAMRSYTRLIAPFDGVITNRFVDTGHLTDPGGARDPLLTIARTDTVRVSIGVPEVDAPLIDVGDPAEIRVQALGGRSFEGAVSRASWALDRATRTLRAEIDLENPDDVLQAGFYVYANIVADEREDVLTLPESAVIRDREGGASCVVLVEGVVQRRELGLGLSDGERVEVVSGLTDGEPVVTSDPSSFEDGQAVDVVEPTS